MVVYSRIDSATQHHLVLRPACHQPPGACLSRRRDDKKEADKWFNTDHSFVSNGVALAASVFALSALAAAALLAV